MGLENFTSDSGSTSSSINTRKKIENVQLSEDSWMHLLFHDAMYASYFARDLDKNEIKAIIQTIDELLKNGRGGSKMTDSQRMELEEAREELVESHLE